MMPGETHSAAPGTAADLSRCQGCASLQQNLNEYVDALITLKQKIINTDNLLTEYQKKCDELQFARRENSTLHHQVEQMLQKISPLQKCQEELGSLKAELEEKKSSLKLYQDTHQEYARVKEECLKTDAQKKKLEAKVKKLEEAAVKQTQDFKQLRNEKKILEKEFRKTQERLDEFSKQKTEKELRHIGTQISSDSYGSIDKRKVKLLLKELWLCINTTHRLPGEGSRCVPEKPAKETPSVPVPGESRGDGAPPPAGGGPLRAAAVQTCLTELSMEIEGDFSACQSVGREGPSAAAHGPGPGLDPDPGPGPDPDPDRVSAEGPNPEVSVQRNDGDSASFSERDRFFDEDLQAAVDFFKLPPPLLSPVPSPPLAPPLPSLPHLSTLPSSLAPETYFGDSTDSSDDESSQPGKSAASVSEDEAPASRYFGSSRKSEGNRDTWEQTLTSREATRALTMLGVNEVTALGFGTVAAALREPSVTRSFTHQEPWAVSSEPTGDGKRGILDEAQRHREGREVDKSVQTESTLDGTLGSVHVGMSSSRHQDGAAALCTADGRHPPLGSRPFSELVESEGKTLLSEMIGSPTSQFTAWPLTNDIPLESHHVSISDHFQGMCGVLGKDRDVRRFILGASPEPADDAGHAVGTTGPGVDARPPSSSTSRASSVCSDSQPFSDTHILDTAPAELQLSEHRLQAEAFSLLGLQPEPAECPAGGNCLEKSSCALSPELGTSDSNNLSSSAVKCTNLVKGGPGVCSLPQSVFIKAMKEAQCQSQAPRTEATLTRADSTSLAESPCSLTKSGFGLTKSPSWHHSDLLRRGSEERLRAQSEHEQQPDRQSQKAAPALDNRGPASQPEAARENNRVGLGAAAALLPNQVSVITKQARAGAAHGPRSEPRGPQGTDPVFMVASVAGRGGEREDPARNMPAVAAPGGTSPQVSASRRKLDFSCPSGSLPVESSQCSTSSKPSFSCENIPVPKQDVLAGASAQEAVQEPGLLLRAPGLGSSRPAVGGRLPPAPAARSFPAGEAPCGGSVTSGGEAPAVSQDPASGRQSLKGSLELPSRAPGATSPEDPGTTGTASLRKDGETRGGPQGGLAVAPCCYTGIREAAGGDTEVEESEAPSGSEGESEPEALMGDAPLGAAGAPREGVGALEAGAAESRPSVEVGCLTSALQDFNISTLSEIDGLSTSEVVMFLESCQLRDYSSGDSVSECSSKGTLSKEMSKELKQGELSGEKYRKQLCEEEALEASEGWVESDEEVGPLRGAPRLSRRSLETLSEVLNTIGQELEASPGKDATDFMLLNMHEAGAAGPAGEHSPPQEAQCLAPHPSGSPPAAATDGSPGSGAAGDRNAPGGPEADLHLSSLIGGGAEGLLEAAEPSPLHADSGTGQTAEAGAEGEAETTFQCQISTVTSKVINVLINKDQNLVIEKGDHWTIINGVALMPNVDQVILCDSPEDLPVSPEPGAPGAGFISITAVDEPPETEQPGPAFLEPQGTSPAFPEPQGASPASAQEEISGSSQSTNFDKSRLRNRPVKPSVRLSSEIYDQNFESQVVASDHTYFNSKLEPFGKNKNRSKVSSKDQSNKPAKTSASSRVEANPSEGSQSFPGERENTKTQRNQAQTILANADTSTPTDSSDTLSKIRQEVGPPLPPLLAPLVATPPRTSQLVSPLIAASSPPSPASPIGPLSPLCEIPVPPMMSPLPEEPGCPSPPCTSPSPSTAPAGERILSSPLQFCAATPKHALPVPGRLPPFAPAHSAVAGPQENSVRILDTMYPELSARARTLNILKGNIQLTRGPPADCKNLPGPVSAITGFKAITSTSTAFVKTGGSSGGDSDQDRPRDAGTHQDSGGKRTLSAATLRSAKRLRLDGGSPEPEPGSSTTEGVPRTPRRGLPQADGPATEEERGALLTVSTASQVPPNPKETVESHDKAIADALKKIAESSFDLLPVIRSHVYVGNISKKPVMRDQEKEVVYEFSTTKKHLAECLLHSILSELKIQKISLERSYIHALCRVYVGICRQLGDLERARLFCYSLLKEDFPESEKLTLFIANMWHDIFISQSVINKAMQLVARQRAKGEVRNCLRAFLNWEKNAPVDVGFMVSKLLLTIQLCPKTEFQSSEKFGEDLSDNTWEYIFAIDLLCCHQRWIWTHDNIISKELWPVMDKWIKYRKGHANIAYTPDIIIASILRLIGRLGQLGLKEGFPSAVKNISSVIGMFIQHAQDEDIPWGIQLAAVYALCDLSPSNPAEISRILEAWRRETSHSVPSAVLSCLEEVSSLCAEDVG
ncbi:little elongation complex subunit 1 isoform X1 [Hyaena hyaena]|uniref:little elongation complex subunit 1 isoform X1 n=1 Tax=Hyaena hyaena TaxID=95912 RepID=UPI001923920D|nr:little elongation complex subunit 1 isoform X1 [Hyaena hyaena]